ncbi:DUF6286 domain-containing protein [Kineosporia succinea]|uniref:DUF6286 domain-containing protein n=1 Tax=Kineosporia succinea TaxID=84632 RepID=A0ABT9P9X2_9ACTN|nr:DUF6286 domain-containing protein [Kineosporia succinea]MDP9829493.1 hypothetical protein [Kineosporia succinea]
MTASTNRAPAATGALEATATLLALLLGAVGVVAVRDSLVQAGVLTGTTWTGTVLEGLDGLGPQTWAVPAGAAVVVAGLVLLVVALRPRPRAGLALARAEGVFLRRRDVGRLAARSARDVAGVTAARARHRRSALRLTVVVDPGQPREPVETAVRSAVEERLRVLASPPRLRISTRAGGSR